MSEVKRYECGAAHCMHSRYEIVKASDYDAALARIATLESDERRRIAGQILAMAYAMSAPHGIVYMTGKQALEWADAVIRRLENAK